jgi:hypothetical protein
MDESLAALSRKPTRRRLTMQVEPNITTDVEGFDLADFMQKVLKRNTTNRIARAENNAPRIAQPDFEITPFPADEFPLPDNAEAMASLSTRLKTTWSEYLNVFTPHRGLLLYHGKEQDACAAVALLEGVFRHPKHRVVILSSKAIDTGYRDELAACSREMQATQRWGYSDKEWKMLPGGAANFNKLSPKEQQEIEAQLLRRRESFTVVCYKTLDAQNIRSRFRREGNPFDGAVVVVEDAHLLSRCISEQVQNAQSHWSVLYEWLLEASDCKVLALAQAPVFDELADLAVVYNVVYGYTRVWTVELNAPMDYDTLPLKLKPWVARFVGVNNSSSAHVVRTPFAFKKDDDKFKKVDPSDWKDDAWVRRELGTLGIVSESMHKLLPDSGKWDLTDQDLRKRIAGLTAYVTSVSLLPVPRLTPHTVAMSPFQETMYSIAEQGKQLDAQTMICNFVYPQSMLRPTDDSAKDYENKVVDAVRLLREEKVFTKLKQFSPKYAELLKSIQAVRAKSDPGTRQMVYCPRLEDALLFSAVLEANAYSLWTASADQKSRHYLLSRADSAKKDAERFNCAEGLDLLLFFGLPGEGVKFDKIEHVHFMQPLKSLVTVDAVMNLAATDSVTAHVYISSQVRDGRTVDEVVCEILNKKKELAKRWVDLLKQTSLKCKKIGATCSLPTGVNPATKEPILEPITDA